jgi:integrase
MPDGSPINPAHFSERTASLVRHLGLPKLTVHGFRHSHASLMLQAGVHPKVVSERLGHASIAITLDTYSHSIPAMQSEAAGRVADAIFGTS